MVSCCSRLPATKCSCVKAQSAKNVGQFYLGLSNSCWTIFLGSSPRSLQFSRVLLHKSGNNSVGFASWTFGGSIRTWIFGTLNYWCIKGFLCFMSMTRSGLVSLQDLLIARRHSYTTTLCFQWKTCDLFFLEITWFCVPLWFSLQRLDTP